jgi:penicillin amidase
MAGEASRARLAKLGSGTTIADVCAADGLTRADFDAWWAAECERRLPRLDGPVGLPVHAETRIARDARGVPHIFATSDHDAFVAYGYAQAQDRLFQMDLRRRRGAGRLAEVLGEAGLEADVLARTMDHPRLAAAEFERLPAETGELFDAFAAGVNAAIQEAGADALPIEFDLLGYEPEPWTALDCAICVTAWRWQLTGRPWVITVPELAKRTLSDRLYDAFIGFQREIDDSSIVPSGESTSRDAGLTSLESVAVRLPAAGAAGSGIGSSDRVAVGGWPLSFTPDPMGGSNNWVVAGSRSKSGKPIVASDPHMPYEAASSFYEVHLSSPSFECAGAGFIGYPGLTFGRNAHVAWAITNNICSQRDLYVEHDPSAVIEVREERIDVRGRDVPVTLSVQVTANGPLVDRLLPAAAAPSGPVAMRWVGQYACDWPSAQMRLDRAGTVDEALTAIRGWLSPTFSLLVADDSGEYGRIAFSNTGTIPVRGRAERGYRDAAHADDAWRGLIPPNGMPQTRDPKRGWLGSANNRPILDAEYPYPLSGTWDENYRHRRIGQLAESLTPHDRATFGQMHTDVHVGRFDERRAAFIAGLDGRLDGVAKAALELLRGWSGDATADSAAASIWEIGWTRWVQAVAAAHFPSESSDFVAGWMNGLAGHLLSGDDAGWFASDTIRFSTLTGAFEEAVEELRTALGDDPSAWQWGRLHAKGLHHPLSGVGDLGSLLDQPSKPAGGDVAVLNNVGYAGGRISASDPSYRRNWEGTSGAGYRVVADLGDPNGSAWTVTLEGQSANAGSPNRSDQLDDFLAGRYHEVSLDRARAEAAAANTLVAEPRARHD